MTRFNGCFDLLLCSAAGLLVPMALILSCGRGHAAETLDVTHFTVTFEETFKSLNITSRGPNPPWTAHTPWHGDFGDAVFDDPGPDGPFSLGPLGLRITAHKDANGKWHSGLICSVDIDGPGQRGFSQRFGYFEMRAKFPAGPGVWPAFWLIGVDKRISAAEIDVVEYYGVGPGYFHNVMHLFLNGKDVLSKDNLVTVPTGSLTSEFNDYGVLIEPDQTRFYLNRHQIWEQPTPPEYRQPMYILANLALGGGWPVEKLSSPAVMEIERISVFQDKNRLSKEGAPEHLR